jgi:hypothetical protein
MPSQKIGRKHPSMFKPLRGARGLGEVLSERKSFKEPITELPLKKFRVVLIKPSKYDDDGYVIRFWKGVLPSNTLNVLHGLTEEVKRSGVFGALRLEIVTFDETAEKLPVKKIIGWSRRRSTKLVVGLVGVQTNQFPRAFDLARQFRAAGIDVIMGGFHTSGTINMLGDQEPDIQALVKESITIVSGEVEENWGEILADALHGRLKRSPPEPRRCWTLLKNYPQRYSSRAGT